MFTARYELYLQMQCKVILVFSLGFDPRLWHAIFEVEICQRGTFSSEYFGFTLSVSVHQSSILLYVCRLLLPGRQTNETRNIPNCKAFLEIEKHWIEKQFHFFLVFLLSYLLASMRWCPMRQILENRKKCEIFFPTNTSRYPNEHCCLGGS